LKLSFDFVKIVLETQSGLGSSLLMKYTSSPRNLNAAKSFAANLNASRVVGSPLRYVAVVVNAESEGYHVVSLGFANSNEMIIVK
jgi:hypothetical protein